MSENTTNETSKSVSTADILGIMLIIGAPDFFITYDEKEALAFALRVYREWNSDWSGEGKFRIEVSLATSNVPVGSEGIARLTMLARTSEFAMALPAHAMYLQPIVLTRQSPHESPSVQACLVTYVRRSPGIKESILLVQGSLQFKH
jgi:hypothetical protein